MTAHSPDHAERAAIVAVGLTKAQREAMLSDSSVIPSMGPFGYDSVVLGCKYGRSAPALHRLELIQFAWAPCLFTELGMSLRASLQNNEGKGVGE